MVAAKLWLRSMAESAVALEAAHLAMYSGTPTSSGVSAAISIMVQRSHGCRVLVRLVCVPWRRRALQRLWRSRIRALTPVGAACAGWRRPAHRRLEA
eukprot:3633072-Pyramimonas_sp.AAC.1